MALFDPENVIGHEATALVALAARISESVGAQAIAEATGTEEERQAATLAKVTVGPQQVSWDGDDSTEDEIATQFCEFQIYAPLEDSKSIIVDGWDCNGVGTFGLIIRRYVRKSEAINKKDVYLAFLDWISRLETDLGTWMLTTDRPRLKGLNRSQGPAFAQLVQEVAQGCYIHASYMIPWGDFAGGDQ